MPRSVTSGGDGVRRGLQVRTPVRHPRLWSGMVPGDHPDWNTIMRMHPASHAEIRQAIRVSVQDHQDQEPSFNLKMSIFGGVYPRVNVERYIGTGYLLRAIEREVMRTPTLAARVRAMDPQLPDAVVEDVGRSAARRADEFDDHLKAIWELYYDALQGLKDAAATVQENPDEWVLEILYGARVRRMIAQRLRTASHLAAA